jgi:hypothetical protein
MRVLWLQPFAAPACAASVLMVSLTQMTWFGSSHTRCPTPHRRVLAMFCDVAANSNPGLTYFNQLLDGMNEVCRPAHDAAHAAAHNALHTRRTRCAHAARKADWMGHAPGRAVH